jgi:hypothetical protein
MTFKTRDLNDRNRADHLKGRMTGVGRFLPVDIGWEDTAIRSSVLVSAFLSM